jgi:hypothetical protein
MHHLWSVPSCHCFWWLIGEHDSHSAESISMFVETYSEENTKDEKHSTLDLEPIPLLIPRFAIMTMIIMVMTPMITQSV